MLRAAAHSGKTVGHGHGRAGFSGWAGRQRADVDLHVGAIASLVELVAGLIVVVHRAGVHHFDQAAPGVIGVGDRLGRRGGRGAKQAERKHTCRKLGIPRHLSSLPERQKPLAIRGFTQALA